MRFSPCYAARAALLPALLGGCVAGPTSRPPRPQPPPPPAIVEQLGYEELIEYGSQLARQQGYEVELLEAVPLGGPLWRLRFGLPPRGSGKLLELELDTATRQLVRSVELQEIAREVLPTRVPGLLADAGAPPETLPGATDAGVRSGPGRSPAE